MKTADLKTLVLANPELEIVPIVSEDVFVGDYAWSYGSTSSCALARITPDPYDEEHMLQYDDGDCVFIEEYFDHIEAIDFDEAEMEKLAKEEYEKLPWQDVILLYIDSYCGL